MNIEKNKLIKFLLIGLVILAILGVVYLVITPGGSKLRIRAGKTEEALLFLMPSNVKLSPDETVEFSLKIDTGKETVSGIEVTVNYNPTFLSLSSPVEPAAVFPDLTSQQKSQGKIILRGQGKVLGQGTIASLSFKALQAGKTKVEISQASIVWDESGQNNIFRRGVGAQLVIE